MKLGKTYRIVRGVINLEETLSFYNRLGYKLLERGAKPTNFALFTDGVINIVVSEDSSTYTGLIYYDDSIKDKVQKIENMGIKFFWKDEKDGVLNQAMFEVIPHKFAINLFATKSFEKSEPLGKSIIDFGKFGELAVPVTNLDDTESIMNKLGFKTTHKSDGTDGMYPWGIVKDGNSTIGLHQTDEFEIPVITYFAENMDELLPSLQNRGIDLIDLEGGIEMGNAKAIAPDGQIFYFFQGKV